jgi:hypothetical protein
VGLLDTEVLRNPAGTRQLWHVLIC